MEFKKMIAGIASRMGLEKVPEPDADGVVRMTFADVEVVLRPVPQYQGLVVETNVCPLPEPGTAAFMAELLRFNHRERENGGVFSADAAGNVFFHLVVAQPLVDDAMCCAALPELVELVHAWREASLKCANADSKTGEAEILEPFSGLTLIRV